MSTPDRPMHLFRDREGRLLTAKPVRVIQKGEPYVASFEVAGVDAPLAEPEYVEFFEFMERVERHDYEWQGKVGSVLQAGQVFGAAA